MRLVTRSIAVPEAREGDYSFLENLTRSMYEGLQADIVKTWTKFAIEIREAGPPFAPMQALIIAGGVEHGKTLYAEEVLAPQLGGFADATLYFTSDLHGRFNDELARAGARRIGLATSLHRASITGFLDTPHQVKR